MNSDNSQLYVPRQGDIIWLNFSPQAGREQAGRRPALVLSKTGYNRRVGLALVCPITNRVKGYRFEVVIPEGLVISGVVLADQIKSFDWQARQAEGCGSFVVAFVGWAPPTRSGCGIFLPTGFDHTRRHLTGGRQV